MSEHDFAEVSTTDPDKCNRSINYAASALIAQQTREYIRSKEAGFEIITAPSSAFSISNYKRKNASNTHLFRKDENATKH